ncbi:MAG TPA: rhodanese-like domain-containing protein [Candidatus Eisenbacteria bacterium]
MVTRSADPLGEKMKHHEGFLNLVTDAKSRVKECNAGDVLTRLTQGADSVVIDVREESEWEAGHIRGAVHLGKGIIERDIARVVPDNDREIILYCGGGFRSALAADNLQKMGYTNVLSMAGGWRAWKENDYPSET